MDEPSRNTYGSSKKQVVEDITIAKMASRRDLDQCLLKRCKDKLRKRGFSRQWTSPHCRITYSAPSRNPTRLFAGGVQMMFTERPAGFGSPFRRFHRSCLSPLAKAVPS
jgi:ribosomal protein L37AE/L43A